MTPTPKDLKHTPNKDAEDKFERKTNTPDSVREKDSLILDDGVGPSKHAPLTGSGNTDEAARKTQR